MTSLAKLFDKPKSRPLPTERHLPWDDDAVRDIAPPPPPLKRGGGVLAAVQAERNRQDELWGADRDMPDWLAGSTPDDRPAIYGVPSEGDAQLAVESMTSVGQLTWLDVLVEEVAEVVAADDVDDLRAELIQVAAVAVAWVEALDERIAAGTTPTPEEN